MLHFVFGCKRPRSLQYDALSENVKPMSHSTLYEPKLKWWCAALITLSVIMSPAVLWSEEAVDGETERARGLYERGRQLEDEGDLAGAYEAYFAANEARPSFRIQRHLGRVSRGSGRYCEAMTHYRSFLDGGGELISAENRELVEQTLEELESIAASVSVTAPEGAEILVDGERVAVAPMSEALCRDPGSVNLEVRLEGRTTVTRSLELGVGEVRVVEVTMAIEPIEPIEPVEPIEPDGPLLDEPTRGPSDERSRPLGRGLFWSLFGSATALLVAGGATGIAALDQQAEFRRLDDPYRNDDDDRRLEAVGRRGEALAIASDVLFGLGGALAAAALVVAFFTEFTQEDEAEGEGEAHLGVGLGALRFWGSF